MNSISNYKNSNKDVYIQQFDKFENIQTNYLLELDIEFLNETNKRQRIIIFKNAEDSIKKMNIILNEIKRIQSYYNKNYLFSIFI